MKYDTIIIGGGLVGLATGLRLLQKQPSIDLVILEKEDQIAQHQSGHNSGVIHSGVYYTPGSLRAKNCIKGYHELLDFCRQYDIPHEICGKVIVATKERELPTLQQVYENGTENGLEGLKLLEGKEIQEYEPYVRGMRAIYVPQSGIADYPAVARQYAKLIKEKGGTIQLNEEVETIIPKNGQTEVVTQNETYVGKAVVNCAGLYSDRLARQTQPDLDLQILPFRGEYYKLKPESRHYVNNLIYPAPDPDFPWLGVHFTRMIDGSREAGPNAVLSFQREGYQFSDIYLPEFWETLRFRGFRKMAAKYWSKGLEEFYRSLSKRAFTKELQILIPDITMDDLEAGGAGVRALACSSDGELIDDYVIDQKGRVTNVCNAPSPAATSSLSIGDYVSDRILSNL